MNVEIQQLNVQRTSQPMALCQLSPTHLQWTISDFSDCPCPVANFKTRDRRSAVCSGSVSILRGSTQVVCARNDIAGASCLPFLSASRAVTGWSGRGAVVTGTATAAVGLSTRPVRRRGVFSPRVRLGGMRVQEMSPCCLQSGSWLMGGEFSSPRRHVARLRCGKGSGS